MKGRAQPALGAQEALFGGADPLRPRDGGGAGASSRRGGGRPQGATGGRANGVSARNHEPIVELVARVLAGPAGRARAGAERLLAERDLARLARLGADEIGWEGELGPAQARRLAAAFELGRRVAAGSRPKRPRLGSARRVWAHLAPELRGLDRETFLALLLDGKHRLMRSEIVSVGTLTASLVHPREFFRPAIRAAAAAVIAVHNHPSGDPEPSAEDVEVTRRLRDAGKLLGIPLCDHVVIGDEGFASMRERLGF